MDQVGTFLNRPRLYYNIDGIGELGGGIMLLGFGLLQWLQVHTPPAAIWHQMYLFVFYMVILLGSIHFGSDAIKKRVTYPRTGFVAYRKRENLGASIASGILSALVVIGIATAIHNRWNLTAPTSLIGVLVSVAYAWRFARTIRWKWIVAGAMAVAAVMIAFLPGDVLATVAADSWATHATRARIVGVMLLSMLVYGSILVISGGVSFYLYLRHTHAPAQDEA